MQQVNTTRGFLTIAQQNSSVDYVRLAYGLALSLKHSQTASSQLTVCVTPGTHIESRYRWAFDQVVEIPWGDQANQSEWKLENEWKAIHMSPYDQTIKLDADMLFFSDIASWWDYFEIVNRPIFMSNTVLNWQGAEIISDVCRKTFTANKLPNVYSAFMYFNKSAEAYEFFQLTKCITDNWQTFFNSYLEPVHRPTFFSTDVAFALASKILDLDQWSSLHHLCPVFTHMKSELQGVEPLLPSNWMQSLPVRMSPAASLQIGNHLQFYPLHYQNKDFLTEEIIKIYERLLADHDTSISKI